MPRKVLVALDDSPHSRTMVDVAFQYAIHHATDQIFLCTVLPPASAGTVGVFPMAPMASAAAVTAVHQGLELQRQQEHAKASETLKLAAELIMLDYKVPRDNIHAHVLPPAGGASGVSDSVLEFARAKAVDLVVVGSRGMGTFKRSLLSLVGLGSVSDALLRGAHMPVMVVRYDPSRHPAHGAEAEPPPLAPVIKRVCVAYDDSPPARGALNWALNNVLGPHDYLHVATVALPSPMPVLDEPAAVAAMEAQAARDDAEAAANLAKYLVDSAAEVAVSHGVTRTKIVPVVLRPTNGSSDIGGALCHYIKDKGIDVIVVGSRGMGAFQRSLMGFIGLGSVSEHLAHNVHCALVVLRNGSGGPGGIGGDEAHAAGESDLARASDNLAFQVIPEETEEGSSQQLQQKQQQAAQHQAPASETSS